MTAEWIGRELNQKTITELRALREQNGLDLCGEQGEYHTLVTNAPEFKYGLRLGAFRAHRREELAYLKMEETKPGIKQ
jgi:diphthamide synthase (EF-2-diphthine--ammonia ligase)